MSSATPQAPVLTAGQNPFQLSQSGAEQSTLGGPIDGGAAGSSSGSSDSPATNGANAFAWILAFAVLGFLLWLVNKTRIGHVLLYYLLILATVTTLITNYRWLSSALAPFTSLSGTVSQAGSELRNVRGEKGK